MRIIEETPKHTVSFHITRFIHMRWEIRPVLINGSVLSSHFCRHMEREGMKNLQQYWQTTECKEGVKILLSKRASYYMPLKVWDEMGIEEQLMMQYDVDHPTKMRPKTPYGPRMLSPIGRHPEKHTKARKPTGSYTVLRGKSMSELDDESKD